MARTARVWWNAQKKAWCTDLGGSRRILAKGRGNKKVADAKLKELLQEQALLASVNGAITVARLCEEFLQDAQEHLAEKTYESYRYSCQKLVDMFGHRAAHTIDPRDIQKLSSALKSSLGDTSRAIVLRSIQRCYNWGVEARLIPDHHLKRIRKPTPRTRDRYVTDEEFQALLRATNPQNGHRSGAAFRRLLVAMDWTFCRPGELSRLKWTHLHLDQNVAILPDHKTKRTGKPKIIPLIPKMLRLLAWMQCRSQSEFCFTNSRGKPWTISAIDQRMPHIKERCGLVDVVPYTIRHRAATNAIIKTGDLKMTSLLMGHTSTATTERYTHLAQQHLVAFAEKATSSRRDA